MIRSSPVSSFFKIEIIFLYFSFSFFLCFFPFRLTLLQKLGLWIVWFVLLYLLSIIQLGWVLFIWCCSHFTVVLYFLNSLKIQILWTTFKMDGLISIILSIWLYIIPLCIVYGLHLCIFERIKQTFFYSTMNLYFIYFAVD